jgi:uncharacterized membrane protein
MRTGSAAVFLWCLLFVAAGLHSAYYYPQLPAMIATHFDVHGNPDDWMTKESCVTLNAVIFIGLSVFLLAMSRIVPAIPDWMVNLPHKDYWLAPERRTESLAYFSRFLLWINNATMLFLIGVFDSVYRANLAAPVRLPVDFWIWLAGLLLFVTGATTRLYLRFGRPPSPNGGNWGESDQRQPFGSG